MSQCDHKRQRSLQYSSIDISKMRMASNHLEALRQELDGIEETEEDLDVILEHFDALEEVLKGANKPRVMVTLEDLSKAGVMDRRLLLFPEKLTELAMALTTKEEADIVDLHTKIKKIYGYVDLAYGTGSHMIIEAILIALAEIASTACTGVAILPGMRVGPSDGVQIVNPTSGFELWLSGNVDYAIIEYVDELDNKAHLLGGSRMHVFDIATGLFFLVEAKWNDLVSCIPEAVSQAIALLKSAKLTEVRFCISDGHLWMFFILKLENGTLTYYELTVRQLRRDVLETSDMPLREILQLMREWLRPTTTGLFLFG